MEHGYPEGRKSPVDAIMDTADSLGMKVFIGCGWARDQLDDLTDPYVIETNRHFMDELAELYSRRPSFEGWYIPVEGCFIPYLSDYAVQGVNKISAHARELTPGIKVLISPYGLFGADIENPLFEKSICDLDVDIIAYQDEVGCVRDKFTLPRLKKNWKRMRDIHNRLNIEMWANCETFTWEEGTNDRQSALIPAAYARLLSQQAAASAAGVDKIISFMFGGIIEDPKSQFQLGQPTWSNNLYTNYMAWKNGDAFWKMFEATLLDKLSNAANTSMISDANVKALADGNVAEENADDSRWVKFEKGHHEVVIDLQKNTSLQNLMVRTLNYNHEQIVAPRKVYVYTSTDGKVYDLASIKDSPYFPNNKHDAWVDGILFEKLNKTARYVKVAFDADGKVYMDEIFVNPVVKK